MEIAIAVAAVAIENARPQSSKPRSSDRCCVKSIAQLAAEYGIHPHQLCQWRDTTLQTLPSIFSDQSAKEDSQREEAHSKQVHDLCAQMTCLRSSLATLTCPYAGCSIAKETVASSTASSTRF